MTYTCLIVPLPPSDNNLFPGKARRYVSHAYASWRSEAHAMLLQQSPLPRYEGPVVVTLSHGRPSKRRMDVHNRVKAIPDLLQEHGVLIDDSQIECLTVQWARGVVGSRIEIEPVEGVNG